MHTLEIADYLYSYINNTNILIYIWIIIAEVISITEVKQTHQFDISN